MTRFKQFSSITAMTAALSMAVTPVSAADFAIEPSNATIPADTAWDKDSENAENHRRYRYRRHRGVSAGDVLTGVLILGGIAAIANSTSRKSDRRYRDDRYRTSDPRYRQRTNDRRTSNSGAGIDRAVDMCLAEIERDVRVESVDGADRTGSGWNVTGRLYNGDGFNCRIGNDGKIDGITYGGLSAQVQDRQWSNERYAQAWQNTNGQNTNGQNINGQGGNQQAAQTLPDDRLPAYPGGPVEGEENYAEDGLGG